MTSFSKNYTVEDLKSFVDEIAQLNDQGHLPFMTHLAGGNEEQLLDIFSKIDDEDYVLSTHRNIYHALLHGIPRDDLLKKIKNGQSMFIFSKKRNFFVSAIIGGTVAIAAGLALAIKRKGSKKKVWCFIGDGTEDNGHFAEAVRYVESLDLPCQFIIEDNDLAVETPKKLRWGRDKNIINWPSCVTRYEYVSTFPHIRTKNFAPLDVLKKSLNDFETNNKIYHYRKKQKLEFNESNSDLSYKDAIKQSMEQLASNGYIFLGYSVYPGNAMGSLSNVNDNLKIETPVAENLMVGLSIGMSLEGFKPVLFFERHDFMLVAADAIGNHLDKINWISEGEFNPRVILKTVVDDGGLFYSGPTHSQDFTNVFREMVNFPVVDLHSSNEVLPAYEAASKFDGPVMIVEHKKYI